MCQSFNRTVMLERTSQVSFSSTDAMFQVDEGLLTCLGDHDRPMTTTALHELFSTNCFSSG